MRITSKLPTGWSKSRIGDTVEDRIEQGLPEDKREFTYVDISAVDNQCKEIVEPKVLPTAKAPSRARQRIQAGDVLVSTTRPNLNAVALVPPKLDGAIASTGFAVLRPILLESRWLFSVVQSEDFVTEMSALVKGALYPAIRPGQVHDYVMRVPPLPEQKRISTKLNRILKRARNLRGALEALPALLQEYRAGVLEAACTGRLVPTEADLARKERRDFEPASVLLERILVERRAKWEADQLAKMRVAGKEPKDDKWKERYNEPSPVGEIVEEDLQTGWTTARLGQLAWSAGYGTSVKCAYEGGGPPVLRIPNVKSGQLHLEDLKFAQSKSAVSSEDPLEEADFVIIRTNGSRDLVGVGALVEKAFGQPHYFASYLIRFRLVSESFHPQWVNMIWAAPSVRAKVLAMAASTTGQYNVSLGNLNNLEIPLPPLAEQKRIVAEVERRLSAIARIAEQLVAALEQTSQLRVSLFHRALSGRLVSQSRRDQPAVHLLESIRHAKAMLPKPSKKSKTKPVWPQKRRLLKKIERLERLGGSFGWITQSAPDSVTDVRSLMKHLQKSESPQEPTVSTMLTAKRPIPILGEILRGHEVPLNARDLWRKSGLSIDDFFAQLKCELGRSVAFSGPGRAIKVLPWWERNL